MDLLPITLSQLFELSQVGIAAAFIGFQTLSLQSDKFICVREQAASNVSVIDVANPANVDKRSIKADSAIMNPVDKIIALRSGTTLQVFKLVMPQPVKVAGHTMSEQIDYWKWISPTVIALVTPKSVYHWDLAKQGLAPELKFVRLPTLNGHQIINYHVSPDMTWLALVGITQEGQRIVGHAQLYSTEKQSSQPLDAHAVAFATLPAPDGSSKTLICGASRNTADAKLFIGEVGGVLHRSQAPVFFPDNAPMDFPVALEVSQKFKVLYLLTKEGYFHLYDLKTAKRITVNKVSTETIFVACPHTASDGIMAINKTGQVLVISVNEANIVNYIVSQLKDVGLALSLAMEANLPADGLFQQQFQQLCQEKQYQDAARLAADSPKGILRTSATINAFKTAQVAGGSSPLLAYFSYILEKGSLNAEESLELCRPVIAQGRKELVENWLEQDKLTCTEALGDLARPASIQIALKMYQKAGAHSKVISILAETGRYDQLVEYCKDEKFQPNWMQLLQSVISNPATSVEFAKMLVSSVPPLMDPNAVIDAFMAHQMVKETTSVLLDKLAADRPEDAALQTRLLELNLKHMPVVADAIFENKVFSHYDKQKVAVWCEQAGLTHRALQHTTNLADIKRLLVTGQGITPEFVVRFFSRLNGKDARECLSELLRSNFRQNLDLAVSIGATYTAHDSKQEDRLTAEQMVSLFEEFNSSEGVFLYLKHVPAVLKSDKQMVHKFIVTAFSLGQRQDLEIVLREYDYDPVHVQEFLKQARSADPIPLIIVCDRFNFVDDLTRVLFRGNMFPFIEAYVKDMNPANTPIVLGTLIEENCPDDRLVQLLSSVGSRCPAVELVNEMEKRNKLVLLRSWLEGVIDGNQEPMLHNALAKIYLTTNDSRCSQFLSNNEYYDSKVIGPFIEEHMSDPNFAFIAYKRGKCHKEAIQITNKHGLFKQQARYLVEEQNVDLWASVLRKDNEFRRQIIDQVIQSVLPETKRADMVSSTVKAFITADLQKELVELLDKIILRSSTEDFRKNRILQNLLIHTAIKVDPTQVMDYVTRLESYDVVDTAGFAIAAGLYEEAFTIYKKARLHAEAVTVLIDHIKKLDRASDFAESVGVPAVFAKLGKSQLEAGMVKEAIQSFLRADDPDQHELVISSAEKRALFSDLAKYLKMCRKKLRKERLDSELAYALAKTGNTAELQELLTSPNLVSIQHVGERCQSEGLYEAARTLFSTVNNYAGLATTLVQLRQFPDAVEAARQANSLRTWKEVCKACVDAREFRFAQMCGLHIMVHPNELEELVQYYEARGHVEELLAQLESALGLERAHPAMYTEIAVLYSKYKPSNLLNHIKLFHRRMNIGKVCQACQENRQWQELAYLYEQNGDFERCARVVLEHPIDGVWDDVRFRQIIGELSNSDLLCDVIVFYLDYHPDLVNNILELLASRLDPAKVVLRVRKLGHLHVIKKYLLSVQDKNIALVNDALADLFVEDEDYDALRRSVEYFDNFDSITLARKLEKHSLLEFRRLATEIYKRNKRYRHALEISKESKMYKDCMEIVAESRDRELAEGLLAHFLEINSPHCFAACLFTCYDLIRPDVALELAWRHKILDFVFPFIVQFVHEHTVRMDNLTAQVNTLSRDLQSLKQIVSHSNDRQTGSTTDGTLGSQQNETFAVEGEDQNRSDPVYYPPSDGGFRAPDPNTRMPSLARSFLPPYQPPAQAQQGAEWTSLSASWLASGGGSSSARLQTPPLLPGSSSALENPLSAPLTTVPLPTLTMYGQPKSATGTNPSPLSTQTFSSGSALESSALLSSGSRQSSLLSSLSSLSGDSSGNPVARRPSASASTLSLSSLRSLPLPTVQIHQTPPAQTSPVPPPSLQQLLDSAKNPSSSSSSSNNT